MKKTLLTLGIAVASFSSSFAQWQNGTDIYNTNTGNVGIGTVIPGAKLTVYQTQTMGNVWSGNSAFNVVSQFGNDANGHVAVLAKNGVANYSGLFLNNSFDIYSYNNFSGWFRVMNNDATKSVPSISLLPDGNGNVGIGTTSPGAKLGVTTSGSLAGKIRNEDATNGYGLAIESEGTAATRYALTVRNLAESQTYFHISTSTGQAGNVGIGTTSPGNKLTVVGGDASITDNQKYILGTYSGESAIYKTTPGAQPLMNFEVAGSVKMVLGDNGNVGIGTTTPDAKLAVNGTIHSKEVKVDLTGWSDYVFEPTYDLPSLTSVKTYIDTNHRLPEMPSTQEVLKNGINLGEMINLQTKKIEELTLYLVKMDSNNKEKDIRLQLQGEQIKQQNARIAVMEQVLSKLTNNK